MTDKLLEAVCLIEKYADNFVSHWMEDDGNDAEDKTRCEQVSDDIAEASAAIKAAFAAQRTMLAALLAVQDDYRDLLRAGPTDDEANGINEMLETVDAAIAAARAAGIGEE